MLGVHLSKGEQSAGGEERQSYDQRNRKIWVAIAECGSTVGRLARSREV